MVSKNGAGLFCDPYIGATSLEGGKSSQAKPEPVEPVELEKTCTNRVRRNMEIAVFLGSPVIFFFPENLVLFCCRLPEKERVFTSCQDSQNRPTDEL